MIFYLNYKMHIYIYVKLYYVILSNTLYPNDFVIHIFYTGCHDVDFIIGINVCS